MVKVSFRSGGRYRYFCYLIKTIANIIKYINIKNSLPDSRNSESRPTLSSNAACWKFTLALSSTHAECVKSFVCILFSLYVRVLPYYILLTQRHTF